MALKYIKKLEVRKKTIFGVNLFDPYAWLENEESHKFRNFFKSEQRKIEDFFSKPKLKAQTEKIFQGICSKIKEDDQSLPHREQRFEYFSKTHKGKQYPTYHRKNLKNHLFEELLDANTLSENYRFFEMGSVAVSPDENYLAYSMDTEGEESFKIYIKDLKTQQIVDSIERTCSPSLEWSEDSLYLFYVLLDENLRPNRVYSHKILDTSSKGNLIYLEKNPEFFVSIHKSDSKRLMYITTSGCNSSEWYFFDSKTHTNDIKLVTPRLPNHEYEITDSGDLFYIFTNHESKNNKLMTTLIKNPELSFWKEFHPHDNSIFLEDFLVLKDFVLISGSKNFESHMMIYPLGIKGVTKIPEFLEELNPEDFYEEKIKTKHRVFKSKNPHLIMEFDDDHYFERNAFRFSINTLNQAEEDHEWQMDLDTISLIKKQEIPDTNFNASDYIMKREWVLSRDGKVKIPLTLFYHKNTDLSKPSPVLLQGYGAYGLSSELDFDVSLFALLDEGFVHATAHVRGGLELGWDWYEQGKLLSKKNSFYDFEDCAKFLLSNNITVSEKLILSGGSAGGMLVAATLNLNPTLYHAAVLEVPFVDVLNTMLDEEHTLTPGEYNEWGNPKIEKFFKYIHSYSPFENIKHNTYPHLFVTCGLQDTRVPYWEAAKWVSKIRDHNKSTKSKILLDIQEETGHTGASGRYDAIAESARELAFMLHILEEPHPH